MEKTFAILIATLTIPALAQPDPAPPAAAPSPLAANPFAGSVAVTLSAGGNGSIWWDTTGSGDLAPAEGNLYADGDVIVIGKTDTLRTVADYSGNGNLPQPANFIYVRDNEPSIAFAKPSANQAFRIGQSVALSATASDADGPDPLAVRFFRVNGSAWTELAPAPLTAPPYDYAWSLGPASPTGAVALRAVATDGRGLADTASVSITIAPANLPPTVSLAASGAKFYAPASFTLTATASDPDGTIGKVEFYRDAELLGTDNAGPAWTFNLSGVPEGDYSYTAVAYDSETPALSATSAAVSVSVAKNNPPVVAITSPTAGSSHVAPYAASVTAQASDADGGVAKVEFYNGATLEATDNTAPFAYSKTYPAGAYKLTAKATDSLGASTLSDTVAFTVTANQKPSAKIAKDTGVVVLPATSHALDGTGSSDPEAGALKYKWTGPVGVSFSSDTSASPIATLPATTGNYEVRLKVTDPAGLSDSAKATLSVWSVPAITSKTADSANLKAAYAYTITGTGFPAPVFGASSLPAWLVLNSSTNQLSGVPNAKGNFNITLTASNGAGSVSKTLVLSVGDSLYPPIITSPASAAAKVGTSFTYHITATGSPADFSYAASGLPAGISLSGSTLSGTPTAAGNFTVPLTVTNTKGQAKMNLALAVNLDPKITTNLPDSLPPVMDKGSATFSIQAQGFPAVSYQWQFSANSSATGFAVVGNNPNAPTYTLNPVSLASAGWYRVLVRNGTGPDVYSKACKLKVTPLPAPVRIVLQPAPQPALVGSTVQFKARATGDLQPLYYQWFRGFNPRTAVTAAKANDTVLTISSVGTGQADVYSVRVTNNTRDTVGAANYAWSDTARLTVQLPKLPNPTASPGGGTIYSPTQVTLSQAVEGATTWYSLDGTDPYPAAPNTQYQGGTILIDATRTLKARSYYFGVYQASNLLQATYTLTPPNKAAKPIFRPSDSTFTGTLTVTITASDGSDVYYTLDGSDPLTSATVCPPQGFPIAATTTVKAVSIKQGLMPSDTAVKVYTLAKPKPKVGDLILSPDSGAFSGSLLVKVTCPTPDAVLRYAVGGADPDSSSPIAPSAGIPLDRTTRLKVVGMLAGYLNSDIVDRYFRLVPGLIDAQPPADSTYADSVHVRLTPSPAGAVIRYTLDGSVPDTLSDIWPAAGLTFATTADIAAVPYLDGEAGNLQYFSYVVGSGPVATPSPSTNGNTFTFIDTLSVALRSTAGASIYYTLDGTKPVIAPENLYHGRFLLDRTTTVQAIAVKPGFGTSKLLSTTFTLIPQKPEMKPPGGSYPLPMDVKLISVSRSASIYYTTDGTSPTPATGTPYDRGTNIRLESPTTLKAIAVAGNLASEVVSEEYTRTRIRDTLLAPGQTLFLDGGYTLRNPENEVAVIQASMTEANATLLPGFDAVQYVLNLSLAAIPANAGLEFPKLKFARPASEVRSLYKLAPSGQIYFISTADTLSLDAGTYFLGIDTLPPTIKYAGESFQAGDSTEVRFEFSDNVANIAYAIDRNDDPTHPLSGSLFGNQAISVRLKHPAGILKPLAARAVASDYRQAVYFPADPFAMLPLSQILSPLAGPPAWGIGTNPKLLYDLIGIPLDLDPPLTFAGLKALNPGTALEGAAYSNADGKFHALPDTAVFIPGRGHWIASRRPVRSLTMPRAVTKPGKGKTVFTLTLRPGWNEISNPHLETLYWPFPRSAGALNYGFNLIKAPWRWDYSLSNPFYVESDSLLPWRGYMVQSKLTRDSVVTLLAKPAALSAKSQAKGAAEARIELAMGWQNGTVLRLGAARGFRDGIGAEDEDALPAPGTRFLNAVRGGRRLSADWVGWDPDGIRRWRVDFGSAEDTLPAVRITGATLPPGYAAWALAPARGMKFPLADGVSIPASGLAHDSLLIVAGPEEKLAAMDLMRGLSQSAPDLDVRIFPGPQGFRLALSLPERARILASVFTLRGTRIGRLPARPLAEGRYEFAWDRDFSDRSSRLGPGMYIVTVEIRGEKSAARLSRKLILPY